MKKIILKQRKFWILVIILLVLMGVGIYVLLPRIDSLLFRKEVGTLDSWKEIILKQRKFWILVIILLVLMGVGIYVLLPRIDSLLFRKEVGTLDSWKEMCKKQRKFWILVIILLVLMGVGIYVLLPRIDSLLFRKEVGTLDSWKEMCNREDARFLSYDIPDSGEQTKDEFHRPKETDSVFSFDGVVKVDDGLYITGIRGLTDWGMMIRM